MYNTLLQRGEHRTPRETELEASKTEEQRRIQGMRKPRELKDGAVYHVTARANRKEMILDNRGMKELFLEVLKSLLLR